MPYSFRIYSVGVGSLTSHIELINMEAKVPVRRDLRFIVLMREDLKV